MEKVVNGRLDTITTTTQEVYRVLKIVFKFVFFEMSKTNSNTCKKFNSLLVVYYESFFFLGLIKFNIFFLNDSKVA